MDPARPLAVSPSASPSVSVVRWVLALPNGALVQVEPGVPIVLGRESSDPRVRAALAGYDGVSRVHAQVTVGPTHLVVRDLDSLNHTFVRDEQCDPDKTLPLEPTTIRLGQRALVDVREAGDAHAQQQQ